MIIKWIQIMKSIVKFSLVAAMDSDLGIGKTGALPWTLRADLRYFKNLTTATTDPSKKNAVLMGRKTWESLPPAFAPLPGRLNAVLTRQKKVLFPDDVAVFENFQDAVLALSERADVESIFVIGGADVFSQALGHPRCEKLFLTHIDGRFACDAFFPKFQDRFRTTSKSETKTEGDLRFHFATYQRKM
jgi:dihydrofolate reductase/thymidylate synthase